MTISSLIIVPEAIVAPSFRYVLQVRQTNGTWGTLATCRDAWMAIRLADQIGGSEDSYRIVDTVGK